MDKAITFRQRAALSYSCDPTKVRILELTLKKKWFDMVASGIKKEEYREIKKYWIRRLNNKKFDVIIFSNGYSESSRKIALECEGIMTSECGVREWGFEGGMHFVISLGKEIIRNF